MCIVEIRRAEFSAAFVVLFCFTAHHNVTIAVETIVGLLEVAMTNHSLVAQCEMQFQGVAGLFT